MLTLGLSQSTHDAAKKAIIQLLPNIKASHRVEAMARGLRFGTHAALIASIASDNDLVVTPSAEPFDGYLRSRGFEVDKNAIYKVVAWAGIAKVMADWPSLGSHGFGPSRPQPGETWAEAKARFQNGRNEMLGIQFAEEVLLALSLVQRIPKTKTVRPNCHSYWLKHIAENLACTYPNGARLGPSYVRSGALITAAILDGFKCNYGLDGRGGYIHPQGAFNMSYPAVVDLDCEIRPDGAWASDRRAKAEYRRRRKLGYAF